MSWPSNLVTRTRTTCRAVPRLRRDRPVVVSLAKGIEQDSLRRMSEVMVEEGDLQPENVAVLSGPNLAREVDGLGDGVRRQRQGVADHSRAG
jgi:glycerol-3-phosphate dehydrogenase